MKLIIILFLTLNIYSYYSSDQKVDQLRLTLLWDRPDLFSNFISSKFWHSKVREVKTSTHKYNNNITTIHNNFRTEFTLLHNEDRIRTFAEFFL